MQSSAAIFSLSICGLECLNLQFTLSRGLVCLPMVSMFRCTSCQRASCRMRELRMSATAQQRWSSSGKVEVSSLGRVKSATGRVSFGTRNDYGYYVSAVHGQSYYVHRLVAATFIGPPPTEAQWQVNHVDGDPSNNRLTNLHYVSQAENSRHSWATNLNRRPGSVHLHKPLLWRAVGTEHWCEASSQAEAARNLGLCTVCISRCYRGLVDKCVGGCVEYEFKPAQSCQPDLLEGESWQPAVYPGMAHPMPDLFVSSHGRVQSVSQSHRRIWYGCHRRSGYYAVMKNRCYLYVHRLVAATFLGQPSSPNLQVNHKDLDRGNNHVDNLEYLTPAQNLSHAHLRRHREEPRIHRGKPVLARIIDSNDSWVRFPSLQEAALHTGINFRVISRVCSGSSIADSKTRSAGWQFRPAVEELLPGEEWRAVVLEGARRPYSQT